MVVDKGSLWCEVSVDYFWRSQEWKILLKNERKKWWENHAVGCVPNIVYSAKDRMVNFQHNHIWQFWNIINNDSNNNEGDVKAYG